MTSATIIKTRRLPGGYIVQTQNGAIIYRGRSRDVPLSVERPDHRRPPPKRIDPG